MQLLLDDGLLSLLAYLTVSDTHPKARNKPIKLCLLGNINQTHTHTHTHTHCLSLSLVLAEDAIKAALKDYKGKQEKMKESATA